MSGSLEIKNVFKRYGGIVVTNDLSIHVPPGSLSAIIGPNGAGKTTLFNLITGVVKPEKGLISLGGKELTGMSPTAIVRSGVGRAFQVASLFPTFTVIETLAACIAVHDGKLKRIIGSFPPLSLMQRARELAGLVGLSAVVNRVSGTLSHGDQKLLDIAIALASKPKVLLLDEPMAGMGHDERQSMVSCIQRLWKEEGTTLLFVEHDMDVVFGIAQHVVVMQLGTKIAEGTPTEVRSNPAVIKAYLGENFQ